MNYYAALDVSLHSVHLCVIDDEGDLMNETKLSSEVTDIIACLDALEPAVRSIIEADTTLSHSLLLLLDARLELYQVFRELENRTRHMAHADPVCRRLMTAPGVGFITVLTYKAGVDDPYRFKRSRTVAAHFGLTPRRFQSGETDIDGHISRCGDREVRCTLYTAANVLLTRSSTWSPLKAWGMKLAKTRGHRRAVMALHTV